MEILRARNIIINDDEFCLRTLEHLNYYRLTAYMLQYKINDNEYKPTTFKTIYYVYEFDRKLRNQLLTILEEIELLLRTKLSYYHAHTFGSLGYKDEMNYNEKHKHDSFMEELAKLIIKNKHTPFVKHHIDSKDSEFPIWVAVELFSFGMLSRFYADMQVKNKKEFSKNCFDTGYQQLESWLLCVSTLRNRCAHYMRLYNFTFNKWPSTPRDSRRKIRNTVFDYIYILRYCYSDNDKWKNIFIPSLFALVDEYKQYIDLKLIGFPENWDDILTHRS